MYDAQHKHLICFNVTKGFFLVNDSTAWENKISKNKQNGKRTLTEAIGVLWSSSTNEEKVIVSEVRLG